MHNKKIKLSKKARDRWFIALFLLPGLFMILVMLYYPAVDWNAITTPSTAG